MESSSSERETRGAKNNLGPLRSAGGVILSPNIPTWARWVVGSIFCLALPFYKKILRIEGAVEREVETVADIVEEVAEVVEKIASDVADSLPGDGKLKEAALRIETIAEEVSKDAEEAEAIIHKVDEMKEEIDDIVKNFSKEEFKDKQAKKNTEPSTDSSKSI